MYFSVTEDPVSLTRTRITVADAVPEIDAGRCKVNDYWPQSRIHRPPLQRAIRLVRGRRSRHAPGLPGEGQGPIPRHFTGRVDRVRLRRATRDHCAVHVPATTHRASREVETRRRSFEGPTSFPRRREPSVVPARAGTQRRSREGGSASFLRRPRRPLAKAVRVVPSKAATSFPRTREPSVVSSGPQSATTPLASDAPVNDAGFPPSRERRERWRRIVFPPNGPPDEAHALIRPAAEQGNRVPAFRDDTG